MVPRKRSPFNTSLALLAILCLLQAVFPTYTISVAQDALGNLTSAIPLKSATPQESSSVKGSSSHRMEARMASEAATPESKVSQELDCQEGESPDCQSKVQQQGVVNPTTNLPPATTTSTTPTTTTSTMPTTTTTSTTPTTTTSTTPTTTTSTTPKPRPKTKPKVSTNYESGCPDDFVRCRGSGLCVSIHSRCDGANDCGDNSDEEDCARKDCRENFFRCRRTGLCINPHFRCDGTDDCRDNSDEEGCPQKGTDVAPVKSSADNATVTCESDEFMCKKGHCIKMEWKCDGKVDCHYPDESDEDKEMCRGFNESNGTFPSSAALVASHTVCKLDHKTAFFCRDGRCMPKTWVCDGSKDCSDGFDEEHCEPGSHVGGDCGFESGPWFKCKNIRNCTRMANVCDGKYDCEDRSDESESCKTSCTGMECEHGCQALPDRNAGRCYCKEGYTLQPDGRTCKDVNECSLYGRCDQQCTNYKGGFMCDCSEGYSISADGSSCKAKDSNTIFLMSFNSQVMGMDGSTMKLFEVFGTDNGYIIGLGYDSRVKKAIWVYRDGNVKSVSRSNLDGTNKEDLPVDPMFLVTPEDLEVDFITGNIYFTDPGRSAITACSRDGKTCADVLNGGRGFHTKDLLGPHKPRGIALNPEDGIMYYTDVGQAAEDHQTWTYRPYIGRSSMDGKSHSVFVGTDLSWPGGVTVDLVTKRVYWVNAGYGTIETIRPDGSDRLVVMEDTQQHPFFLSVFEGNVYWSDWRSRAFQTCDRFNLCKNHKKIPLDQYRQHLYGRKPLGVHVFNPVMEHAVSSQVSENPCNPSSKCSHLCLLGLSHTYTCACPPGHILTQACSPTEFNSSVSTCNNDSGSSAKMVCTLEASLRRESTELSPSYDVSHSMINKIRKFFGQPPKEDGEASGTDPDGTAAAKKEEETSEGRKVGIGLSILMVVVILGIGIWCLVKSSRKRARNNGSGSGNGGSKAATVMRFRNQRFSMTDDHEDGFEDFEGGVKDPKKGGLGGLGGVKGEKDVLLKGLHPLDAGAPLSLAAGQTAAAVEPSGGSTTIDLGSDSLEGKTASGLPSESGGGEKSKSFNPKDFMSALDTDRLVQHMPSWRNKSAFGGSGVNKYERM